MKNTIQTGIRLSPEIDSKIADLANQYGMSKNSVAKMLIVLGLKAFESISANLPNEFPHAETHTQR